MNEQEVLIIKLKQGDETAFKTVVEKWQDMVYNTAISIVQNAEDAEDITQETFIQVHQSVQGFKGESKFSTWLYRIVLTKALDNEKKKKRKKRFALIQSFLGNTDEETLHPPDFEHPGILAENKEQAKHLFNALKQVPDNQRIAFTLHKMEGLSYQETAEAMGTTLAAVESLMGRAKSNLKKILEKQYNKNK